MKRLKFLVLLLVVLLPPARCLADGTVTQDGAIVTYESGGSVTRVLTMACTADAALATIPDTAISAPNAGLLKGWHLYKVDLIGNTGGTEVTDDCDVYLYQSAGGVTKAIDLLGGNGVNKLDKDVNYSILPAINGTQATQPFVGTWTLGVDNIGVNSAVFYVVLYFKPGQGA